MRDIFFYNFSFEPIGQFAGFVSFNITKKYCGFGTAEIHFSINRTDIISLLQENRYIICIAGDKQMIVTGWQLGDDIAIFGRTPEWLLTKRVVPPFAFTQTSPADIAIYAIETAVSDFADVVRETPAADGIDYSSKEPETAYNVVCDVLNPAGLGFKLNADVTGKKFVFSVFRGRELSLMISVSNRTACNMRCTWDMQDRVDNCGWYQREMQDMGEWSASGNSPVLKDNVATNAFKYYKISSEGIRFGISCEKGWYLYCDNDDGKWKTKAERPDLVWTYIDRSSEFGAARWEGILQGVKTPDEANAEFADMKIIQESETALRHIDYGDDYSEGDIVRVQMQFGDYRRTERKRVGAVEIFYDIDSAGTKPILESLEE